MLYAFLLGYLPSIFCDFGEKPIDFYLQDSLVLFFDLRYYKAYRQLRQKAITTPNNLYAKNSPITDKNGTAISDGAAYVILLFCL